MIKFVDLDAQYQSIKSDIDSAIADVLSKTSFVGGPFVEKFEEEFAAYIGTQYAIGCANGTDSIELALKAMGVGPGDEVIVPANSWISTSEAVTTVGAQVVFADCLADLYTIDPDDIERKISDKTKAIIPVHLYGLPAEMGRIMQLAAAHDLLVLEDCAQAHGARWKGQKVGTFGDAASFSFYPGKNLGAYGDGGAVCTNSAGISQDIRRIGNHGQLEKHDHRIEGRNSRLDSLQAAVLSVKLKHLDHWNEQRAANAEIYSNNLSGTTPTCPEDHKHVYHLYVIQTDTRDETQAALKTADIQSAVHYPVALPLLRAYEHMGHTAGDFPVAAAQQGKILSLPMYAELEEASIMQVCEVIESL